MRTRTRTCRLHLEILEDRCVLSTFAAFDLDTPDRGPFPSDRFTVADASQLTNRRINLPLPDAASRPSDYADVSVINTLDGFNLQPRLSIPFSGPIDVTTVNSTHRLPGQARRHDFARGQGRPDRRHQSNGLGCRHEHAARRVGRTPRSAHALRADRDPRSAGCGRRAGRAERGLRALPPRPQLRADGTTPP